MPNFATTKRVLVGKAEAVAGTVETLADADFDVRAEGVEYTPDIAINDEASKVASGGYVGSEVVHGTQSLGHVFTTKAAEGADVQTEPAYWKMLNGCGLVSKAYSTTGVALQDAPEGDIQTMTLGAYENARGAAPVGTLEKAAGAMGNATFSVENVGMPMTIAYDFKGKYSAQQDVANGSVPVLTGPDTAIADPFLNATVTIGAFSACLASFTFDLGNTIAPIKCQSEASGIMYYTIGARNPNLQMSFIKDTVANYGSLAKTLGEVIETVTISWGNNVITFPRVQVLTPATADGDGTVLNQMSYKILENAGTDSDIDDRASFEWLIGARA